MSNHRGRVWSAAVCAAALIGPALSARAESLADALALAYQSSPTLQSQRALQRQLDESYVQARAGLRPTASVSGSVSWSQTPSPTDQRVLVNRNGVGATLSAAQPLYTGGRASAAIDVAEAQVLAGRQNLRATEQAVLQSVIQAYADVIRDQQIVGIRQQSVTVLANQLQETQARFQVGLLTRTDVARAEAQVAAARAALSTAQAQLQNSRANYTAAVGQNPGELTAPPGLPGLPATVDDAFQVAETENPTLNRAQINEQASRYRVAQARAQRNPTVSLQGSFGEGGFIDPLGFFNRSVTVGGVVTQPLVTGGTVSSQIRAALEQDTSDRILIEQSRRTTVQAVAQAWNTMQAALSNTRSGEEQVRAATVALEGTQEQYRVGLSTTLDVLLTEETLRTAQLSLAQAQHDLYVAEANLLSAMGRLDARNLVQGVPLYDPEQNFVQVKNASAVPWEAAVEALDRGARPAPADPTRPISAPAAASAPYGLRPASTGPSTDAGFATTIPTVPATGTTSPLQPAARGERVGAPGEASPPPPAAALPTGGPR